MSAANENIVWHASDVSPQERTVRNGHRGAVVWLTGLSGSGKSSIAVRAERLLFDAGVQTYILDGDNIRHGLNSELGFSTADRDENIRRIGEVARLFADSGAIVLTAFISPLRAQRRRVRGLLGEGGFVEVFVDADIETCQARDPKGLYQRALAGEIDDFTGISAPYEEPESPELVIDTDRKTIDQSAHAIVEYLRRCGIILERAVDSHTETLTRTS